MEMPYLTRLVCQSSSPAPSQEELASGLLDLPQGAWLLLVHVALSLAWHCGPSRGRMSNRKQAFADASLSLSWVWVWQSPNAGSSSHCVGLLSWKLQRLAAGVALRGLWSGHGCQKDQAGDCRDLRMAGESRPEMGMEGREGRDSCSEGLFACAYITAQDNPY